MPSCRASARARVGYDVRRLARGLAVDGPSIVYTQWWGGRSDARMRRCPRNRTSGVGICRRGGGEGGEGSWGTLLKSFPLPPASWEISTLPLLATLLGPPFL